uniref:Uncharacterized protein n=1 Tax=Mycena chlorophos TaxID=658473 RepID=A0ABQ0M5J7_MYCCL|nr:predicted protein [Mycena chlorophos]
MLRPLTELDPHDLLTRNDNLACRGPRYGCDASHLRRRRLFKALDTRRRTIVRPTPVDAPKPASLMTIAAQYHCGTANAVVIDACRPAQRQCHVAPDLSDDSVVGVDFRLLYASSSSLSFTFYPDRFPHPLTLSTPSYIPVRYY